MQAQTLRSQLRLHIEIRRRCGKPKRVCLCSDCCGLENYGSLHHLCARQAAVLFAWICMQAAESLSVKQHICHPLCTSLSTSCKNEFIEIKTRHAVEPGAREKQVEAFMHYVAAQQSGYQGSFNKYLEDTQRHDVVPHDTKYPDTWAEWQTEEERGPPEPIVPKGSTPGEEVLEAALPSVHTVSPYCRLLGDSERNAVAAPELLLAALEGLHIDNARIEIEEGWEVRCCFRDCVTARTCSCVGSNLCSGGVGSALQALEHLPNLLSPIACATCQLHFLQHMCHPFCLASAINLQCSSVQSGHASAGSNNGRLGRHVGRCNRRRRSACCTVAGAAAKPGAWRDRRQAQICMAADTAHIGLPQELLDDRVPGRLSGAGFPWHCSIVMHASAGHCIVLHVSACHSKRLPEVCAGRYAAAAALTELHEHMPIPHIHGTHKVFLSWRRRRVHACMPQCICAIACIAKQAAHATLLHQLRRCMQYKVTVGVENLEIDVIGTQWVTTDMAYYHNAEEDFAGYFAPAQMWISSISDAYAMKDQGYVQFGLGGRCLVADGATWLAGARCCRISLWRIRHLST